MGFHGLQQAPLYGKEVSQGVKGAWLTVLALIHTGLLVYGAWCHSPTFDEVAHLPAGISVWQSGRFDQYAANPPLIRMLAAAPVMLLNPATDWQFAGIDRTKRPEFDVGRAFVRANGQRTFRIYFVARLACIPLSLLAGYVCFLWARSLYGEWSGLFAVTLWCFSPTVLANGQLITPDMGAAAFGVLALYTFRKWCWQPTLQGALVAGLTLGLMELTKLTWLVSALIYPAMWGIVVVSDWMAHRQRKILRDVAQLICVVLVSLWVLNSVYLFDGTFTRLKSYEFASTGLGGHRTETEDFKLGNRFSESLMGELPVPLPAQYLLGFDTLKCVFEHAGVSYLNGEFRVGGWWYYFYYAAGVKTPLGTLGLLLIASMVTVRYWRPNVAADELMLLLPVAVILLACALTPLNRHFRYLLVIIPFVLIFISKVAQFRRHRWISTPAGVCAAWAIASSLAIYPHNLSYFNELAGGPIGGRKHLIDSNIDWGQDYLYFKDWIEQHPEAKDLKLDFFGCFRPLDVGDSIESPPLGPSQSFAATEDFSAQGPQPGWYAMSVTLLQGAWSIDTTVLDKPRLRRRSGVYFQQFEPIAYAGYSIYLYHLGIDEVNAVRGQLGLPAIESETSEVLDINPSL